MLKIFFNEISQISKRYSAQMQAVRRQKNWSWMIECSRDGMYHFAPNGCATDLLQPENLSWIYSSFHKTMINFT